ncbi:helix-turn-helix transcriptional regulator [Crossiella sp. CA-258035]|uniref:helix-turn-helix domain-containing protein n=1 Tax=Crossiella sp. CA-258035 TaxID=2981138 RepID=UPI0024BC84AE|nr:helix-turn-helix transcriptional regulator [Crossiella sp. CA-258035]WHT23117.1 helix-turn-helix transcriptional regulator [Crossiella sp. CA-258035]
MSGTEPLPDLLAALHRHGRVALFGPAGSGKTAVAHGVAAAAARGGALVMRSSPCAEDPAIVHSGLAELLTSLAPPSLAMVTGDRREVLSALVRRGPAPARGTDPLAVRLALAELLDALATRDGVLVVLDGVQWLDPDSRDALRGALRAVRSPGLRLLTTERRATAPVAGHELCQESWPVPMPALTPDALVDLVTGLGLPHRWTGQVLAHSGGNPALAVELTRALLAGGRAALPPEPLSPSPGARELIRLWLNEIGDPVRRCAVLAALCRDPTVTVLNRIRPGLAAEELATAEAARLLRVRHEEIRFTAAAIPLVLAADAGPDARARAHARLADAVDDPVAAVWHQAHAHQEPDRALARRLRAAAEESRTRGAHAFAAELGLLAARRLPPGEHAELVACLLAAAIDAGAAGRSDLARAAAHRVLPHAHRPADRVRVRLALLDAACQRLGGTEEVLAKAREEAGDDPELLAEVHLRTAIKAHIADGDTRRAAEEAGLAAALATGRGPARTLELALLMRARMQRGLGDPAAERTLARALECAPAVSARFLAARHAFFDDRLDAAREELLALLQHPVAHSGATTQLAEVLRCLVELEARAGHCRAAIEHARRLTGVLSEAGAAPGLSWYAMAVAESAGGEFARAARLARLGAAAAEEEGDVVFLPRSLLVLGTVELATGEAARAVAALERVRVLETAQQIADPSVLRWHGELAEALVGAGDPAAAATLVERTRHQALALDRPGVLAALDRAEALVRIARRDLDGAAGLLTGAGERFAALGLPIEHGRTLLALGRLERSRRRGPAARSAVRAALTAFQQRGARPWAALAATELDRLGSPAAIRPAVRGLTAAEAELAALVAEGLGNREAATRLFLSVKTVEGRLTRIYRKVGVRSRAQLVAALRRSPGGRIRPVDGEVT